MGIPFDRAFSYFLRTVITLAFAGLGCMAAASPSIWKGELERMRGCLAEENWVCAFQHLDPLVRNEAFRTHLYATDKMHGGGFVLTGWYLFAVNAVKTAPAETASVIAVAATHTYDEIAESGPPQGDPLLNLLAAAALIKNADLEAGKIYWRRAMSAFQNGDGGFEDHSLRGSLYTKDDVRDLYRVVSRTYGGEL